MLRVKPRLKNPQEKKATEELLGKFGNEARKRKRAVSWLKSLLVTTLLYVAYYERPGILHRVTSIEDYRTLAIIFGCMSIIMMLMDKLYDNTRLLGSLNDVSMIGPLAEALYFKVDDQSLLMLDALTCLLTKVNATTDVKLTRDQLTALHRTLTPSATELWPTLSVAVIRALPYLGDETSVDPVERLAADHEAYPIVQKEAKKNLPAIRQRAELFKAIEPI